MTSPPIDSAPAPDPARVGRDRFVRRGDRCPANGEHQLFRAAPIGRPASGGL